MAPAKRRRGPSGVSRVEGESRQLQHRRAKAGLAGRGDLRQEVWGSPKRRWSARGGETQHRFGALARRARVDDDRRAACLANASISLISRGITRGTRRCRVSIDRSPPLPPSSLPPGAKRLQPRRLWPLRSRGSLRPPRRSRAAAVANLVFSGDDHQDRRVTDARKRVSPV